MKYLVFSLVLILSSPITVKAEAKLSIQEAVKMALEHNQLLKAAKYEEQATSHELSIRQGNYLPIVSLQEEAARSNAPTKVFMMKLDEGRFRSDDFEISSLNNPGAYTDFRTSLSLEQPVFDRSLALSVDMAKIGSDIAVYNLESKRADIGLKVYSAWLEVRRARTYIVVAEQSLLEAKENLRMALARADAGTGLKSDGLRARTFLYETEQQSTTAKNDLYLAKLKLGLAIGVTDKGFDIEDQGLLPDVVQSEEDLKVVARMQRNDLTIIKKQGDQAAVAVDIAKAGFLPKIYASANYQMHDNSAPFGRDNDSWAIGVGLKWELFSGMRTMNEVKKAKMLSGASAEYLQNSLNIVDYQVTENIIRYQEATEKLEIARLAVIDAEESVRLIGKRFQNSLSTMVELLDAQTALNKARAVLAEMENGKAFSIARVYQSTGTFMKEVLK